MQSAAVAVQVVIGVLTVGLGVLVNYLAATKAAARFEGAAAARLDAHDKALEHIRTEQGEQWDEIRAHAKELGYLRGRANGKATGPMSGFTA